MTLKDATLHCERAWSQYAEKNNIKRDDVFYVFKMQEELGELTRSFLELRGSEKKHRTSQAELQKKFHEDIAVLIGNSLILAHHFKVDLEKVLKEKFPVGS